VLPWTRDPQGPTAGVKASSTAATRIGLRYATERRAATGIWLTPDGNVSEALAANVFCVLRDAVVTPGCRAGVAGHEQRVTRVGLRSVRVEAAKARRAARLDERTHDGLALDHPDEQVGYAGPNPRIDLVAVELADAEHQHGGRRVTGPGRP